MPREDLSAAIAALERRLAENERKSVELRRAINILCEEGGQQAKYSESDAATGYQESGAVLTQIRRDTFYGKKQMTAIREYLEMRRSQGDGPATPAEILDALKVGGYKFEAKSDEIALVGLRALLRKATTVFHKLPGTRSYGLLSWYPNAKASDNDASDRPQKKKRRASKRAPKTTPKTTGAKKRTGPVLVTPTNNNEAEADAA